MVQVERVSGLARGAYNLGVIRWQGELLCSARHHPVARNWKTRVSAGTLNSDGGLRADVREVEFPKEAAAMSHEDMRLFQYRGKLMASYVLADLPGRGGVRCVVGYGELTRTENRWRMTNCRQPDYGCNDWSGKEKNWVFFEYDGRLCAIYQCDRQQVVLELDEGWWTTAHRTAGPGWSFGEIRGGTSPLPFKGQWLRFFHSGVVSPPVGRTARVMTHYHMGAMLLEPHPPFRITAVSAEPILSGTGECPPGVWHWKPNVCIPYGALEAEKKGRQKEWLVSVGINDGACGLVRVAEGDLKL